MWNFADYHLTRNPNVHQIPTYVVTMLGFGQSRNRGSIPGRGEKFFSFPKRPDWFGEDHSASYPVDAGLHKSGQSGRDASLSPVPTVSVKKACRYSFTAPNAIMT